MSGDDAKSSSELVFYNAVVCPFGMRAWLTLLFKGVEFEAKWVDLAAKSASFTEAYSKALGAEASSSGKVPLIGHCGKFLAESAVIARYLDAAFADSGPRIVPKDAWDLARVELAIEKCAAIVPLFYGIMKAPTAELRWEKIEAMQKVLSTMEALLKEASDSGYLLDDVSLFDIMYLPFFDRFCVIERLITEGPTLAADAIFGARPRLKNWFQALQNTAQLKRCHAETEKQSAEEHYQDYYCKIYGTHYIK